MTILSSFINLHVIPNLYDFLLWNIKEDMNVSTVRSKQLKSMRSKITHIVRTIKVKIPSFEEELKSYSVWHDMRLSKWWQNYHFGRNIPLSHLCSSTIKVWSLTAASYLPLQTVGAGGETWFQEAGGCGPARGIFSGRFFGLRTRLREWHCCQVQQCRIATATNMQRHVCEK